MSRQPVPQDPSDGSWNAGTGPSGGVGPPNREPRPNAPLPPVSAELAAESNNENALVAKLHDVNRTARMKPYRPSYGTKGDPVEFSTNYFLVKLPQALDLYRYKITINALYKDGNQLPGPKNKKLKQIIKIMLGHLQRSKPDMPIATDFKSTLICAQKISQDFWATKVMYSHEDDHAAGMSTQTYTLQIEETPPHLSVSGLKDLLASTNTIAPFDDKESMLQALNIIFGHHAKSSSEITMIGGNEAYKSAKDPTTEKCSLTAGLEAIRGYFLSVRLASFRALVNVNVSHGAFYEAIPLTNLIDKWVSSRDAEYSWHELEAFLKGVKVKTHYLKDEKGNHITQVRSIKGFASKQDGLENDRSPIVEFFAGAPGRVWFHLDDKRDFAEQKSKLKDKKGAVMNKYISVDEFFANNHHVKSDPGGKYPVVNFSSRADPTYVPAEACTVELGQLAKLTPDQTDSMIEFAVRKPSLNAVSITSSGLPVLGLSPTGTDMRRFDIEIDDKMVAVYGRMLTRPDVLYKNNKLAMAATGGWNLREVQFKIPVPKTRSSTLEEWGCLRVHGSSDGSSPEEHQSAISEFRSELKLLGIETSKPLMDDVYLDEDTVSRSGSKGLRTIDEVIQDMQQKKKMSILLIFLPYKDTTLYNDIKKSCDRIIGIHTVCVVEGNFYKLNATTLTNVALKFNLKLGGTNHTLKDIDMGIISLGRTMVVGINVVHPSPGSGKASIASMVASINKDLAQWPVDLRVQVREGQEMLDKIDIMLKSRLILWRKHHKVYPENVLVYRDGVSESQYQQTFDEELKGMQEISKKLYSKAGEPWPRFTLIIVVKRHHTRFFPPRNHPLCDGNGNPRRGLVVDRSITEARNWDFFLQSHDAIQGTARPAHYYVLWDEIFTDRRLQSVHEAIERGISPVDRLQQLSYNLCYLFSRAAKAVSIPAPVYYADIACTRAGRYLVEIPTDSQPTTTNTTGLNPAQRKRLCAELQEKIEVHRNLKDSMFYI